MARFSIDIIGMCAFGLEFRSLTEADSEYRRVGKEMFAPTLRLALVNAMRFAWPKLLSILKVELIPEHQRSFFFNLLRRSEEIRKSETTRRNDFIQLMLDIKEKEISSTVNKTDENEGKYSKIIFYFSFDYFSCYRTVLIRG